MNIQLDKRLGKVWMQVEQRLKFDLNEIEYFRKAAVKAKDFEDLPQSYQDLVLDIEGKAKEKAA